MHPAAREYVRACLAYIPPPRVVVELGSRSVNGGVRDLLPRDCRYTGVDQHPGDGADVVADAATYRPEETPDLVLCLETLEHAHNAAEILANAARILAPGGWLIVTCAAPPRPPHSLWDGGPGLIEDEHYANIEPVQLEAWLAPFTVRSVSYDGLAGDVRACGRKSSPEDVPAGFRQEQ